jgi:hypothetical protein
MNGPDTRHLIETEIFTRLKDAKEHVKALTENRAYQLDRLTVEKTKTLYEWII